MRFDADGMIAGISRLSRTVIIGKLLIGVFNNVPAISCQVLLEW